jgi:hypothetical protein
VVGGLLAAGAIAAALQTFDYPFLVSQGDGSPDLETPAVSVYKRGLIEFRLGEASAIATVLLGVLVVLGLAAVALIIATGTRIEVDPPSRRATPEEPTGRRARAMALGGAGLVAVLAVTAYGLWPWLSGIGRTDLGEAAAGLPGATPSRVRLNTWSPALVSAAVGVALAALAGFGIGALRPLGRWSELLLLPFAPWLFVGTGPLAIANFRAAFDDGEVNTFVGLLSPSWLPIPALLVFTLLARGLRRRWERRGAGVSPVLAGSWRSRTRCRSWPWSPWPPGWSGPRTRSGASWSSRNRRSTPDRSWSTSGPSRTSSCRRRSGLCCRSG